MVTSFFYTLAARQVYQVQCRAEDLASFSFRQPHDEEGVTPAGLRVHVRLRRRPNLRPEVQTRHRFFMRCDRRFR